MDLLEYNAKDAYATLKIYQNMTFKSVFEHALLGPCLTMSFRGIRVNEAKLRQIRGKKPKIGDDGRLHPSWYPSKGLEGGLYCRTSPFGDGGKIEEHWDIYMPDKNMNLFHIVYARPYVIDILEKECGVSISDEDDISVRLLSGQTYRSVAKDLKMKPKEVDSVLSRLIDKYPEVFEWHYLKFKYLSESGEIDGRVISDRLWSKKDLVKVWLESKIWRKTLEMLLFLWDKHDPQDLEILACWRECILVQSKSDISGFIPSPFVARALSGKIQSNVI